MPPRSHAVDPSYASRRLLTAIFATVLALAGLWGSGLPAQAAVSLTVTPTTTTEVPPNATTTLAGLGVSGASDTDFQVTLATQTGSLNFPQTSGLELAFGNSWSDSGSVTFSGSEGDINAALAVVQLVTGGDVGTTTKVSITASPTTPGYIFAAENQHFYQFVPAEGIGWAAARKAAQAHTFLGQNGYLATIPTSAINDLVANRIEGAENVWFGAHAVDTFDSSTARTWVWADGPLADTPLSYCSNAEGGCDFINDAGLYHNWAPGEPNNCCALYDPETGEPIPYTGEDYPVTNWGGSIGYWNDLPDDAGFNIGGYVVEYGDQVDGASSFPGVVTSASDVAVVSAPDAPTDVSAARGNGSATVSFTAPAANGSPITSYTVTASPGGATTTCESSPCTVEGLDNGTAYTFTVTATNVHGAGPASDTSDTVVPATVPGVPTTVSAVGGGGSALVTFTPPDDDGGTPVTSYTVTSSPGGATTLCPGSPCLVEGLTNGVTYSFTVVATNDVGSSEPSAASSDTEVRSVPGAPTDVSATANAGSATVSFTAPDDDGGAEITGYLVTSSPGGLTASCSKSPCVVSGLTNGTTYTFTVQALNVAGASESSDSSSKVTPITVPTGPVDLQVDRGDRSAEITFVAPADDGGSGISSYQVSTDGGLTWKELETTGTSPLTATVDGLSNGTRYQIAVRAVNEAGPGPATELSNVTPAGLPDTPTGVTATRGDGQATVTFTAPSDNGSAITGYIVVVAPGGEHVSCDASPCVVTGLDNGSSYTFRVYATNEVGDSEPSGSTDPVVPASAPSRPNLQSVVSVDRGLVVSFSPSTDDGGADVLGYQVSLDDGDTWSTLPVSGEVLLTGTVTGLVNGQSYAVRVRAVNAVGGGKASESMTQTAATTPSAPRSVAVKLTNGKATVTWKAPSSDGGSPITGYEVVAAPGGQVCRSLTTSCTFAGLTPGVEYTFAVAAINTVDGRNGTGRSVAAVSSKVLLTDVPTAPRTLAVSPGDRKLGLTFSAPLSNGGRAISSYEVSLNGGKTWSKLKTTGSSNLKATVSPVTNGASYAVEVRARNGNGAGSATSSVPAKTTAWFSDPVSKADRDAEISVPKSPTKYKGSLKHTKATNRSRNGTIAYPVAGLDGRQLQAKQAVEISGSLFAFNKSKLSSTGVARVKALADSLTYVKGVTCEGYADYGGSKSNETKLAKARATTVCSAVKKYAKQVTSRKIVGYGSSYPVIVGGKASDRAANRRVVVLIRS